MQELIACPECSAVNRVPVEKIKQKREAVCGRCKKPLDLFGVRTITDANFADEVDGSTLPVLIDMWAPWCGPCRTIGPVVEQLAHEWAGRLRVGKMNVDDNQVTASRFNVRSIPTLLIMQGGREVERITGAVPKTEIVRHIERVVPA